MGTKEFEILIRECKHLINITMDKSAVVRDIKQRTGFKSCSDKVCCNCVYVDNNEQYGLECTLNPVYPFGVQPFNTCAEFKKTSMDISIY